MKKNDVFSDVLAKELHEMMLNNQNPTLEKAKEMGGKLSNISNLLAVSPIDGRYASTGESFSEYFSEYALIKHRLFVEISWLDFFIKTVNDIPALKDFEFDDQDENKIWDIYYNFNPDEALKIKGIEETTKHDVKAVEYYIDKKLIDVNLDKLVSLVHIGCTSEDINNTAYALMLVEALKDVWIPAAEKWIEKLTEIAYEFQDVVMLGHTHGQKATPVTVGKEFSVFVYRLQTVLDRIKSVKIKGKFNGATGCYSALTTTFPEEDWQILCKQFIEESLGLDFNPVTTQIESHDYMASLFDEIRHFNNIILDIDVDMWMYISRDYIKQIPKAGEVGSSVMPHKVNPIFFENSEANADISNAIFMALSNKLTKSRWQRDLSDSASQRYIGIAFACSLLAINNALRAISRCDINIDVIDDELNESWEILAEPIQTMLRKYGVPDAYDQLKEMTRGKAITDADLYEFISGLDILSEDDKKILLNLTPSTYIGRAEDIVDLI